MICFCWEIWLWVFLGLFLFYFCLVWGEQVTDAQDFGWQSKGEDHFRSWFPFFSCLLGDNFVLFGYLSGPKTFLHISSIFFRYLIGNFLSFFCFLPLFDWEFFLLSSNFLIENFLFFFCFEGKDGHSHPGSRFMVSWDFGLRLAEQLDMIYVWVLVWPAVQG